MNNKDFDKYYKMIYNIIMSNSKYISIYDKFDDVCHKCPNILEILKNMFSQIVNYLIDNDYFDTLIKMNSDCPSQFELNIFNMIYHNYINLEEYHFDYYDYLLVTVYENNDNIIVSADLYSPSSKDVDDEINFKTLPKKYISDKNMINWYEYTIDDIIINKNNTTKFQVYSINAENACEHYINSKYKRSSYTKNQLEEEISLIFNNIYEKLQSMSLIKVLTLLFDIDMNINTHYFLFYYLSRLIPKYFIGFEIFYSLDENPIRNYYIYDNISEKYIIS